MKMKARKSLVEMKAPAPAPQEPKPVAQDAPPSSYTLTPAERAPIDAAIAQVTAIEQQARGMVNMLINIHGLTGTWDYDRAAGRLVRAPETQTPTQGETK